MLTIGGQEVFRLPSLKPTAPPPVQYPKLLLTYSHDPTRAMHFDNSALRYFREPPIGASLSRGYENWIKRPEGLTRLDTLLEALQQKAAAPEAARCDVVTWRGIMTK